MANFLGYFLATANPANNSVYATLPSEYIQIGSYSSLPNSREEIKAYRDDNTRDLTRVTAAGTKSSFSFETLDRLSKEEVEEIQAFFTSHETSALERKVYLKYWNMEEMKYKYAYFYRADINFTVHDICATGKKDSSGNEIYDMFFNSLEISMVEY